MMIPARLDGAGTLRRIELWTAPVTRFEPLLAAHGRHGDRTAFYVAVITDEGRGWGEIVALDHAIGSDPSTQTVLASLKEQWVPRLIHASASRGGRLVSSADIASLGGSSASDRTARAALEMAVMDLELKGASMSLASWLEVTVSEVPFGGLVGLSDDGDLEAVRRRGTSLLTAGATRLRLKIEPGKSLLPAQVLTALAPPFGVQVDANGSFSDDEGVELGGVQELRSLDELALNCIEQPLARGDLAASAILAAKLRTPLCLDEDVTTTRSALDALRYRACQMLCVKPARVGGIRSTLRILDVASGRSARSFIGGMFETGLGRSVLQALAGTDEVTDVSDVAAASTYLIDDPCEAASPEGDRQPLWRDPGVGPSPKSSSRSLLWARDAGV